jgi:hypothetical protein
VKRALQAAELSAWLAVGVLAALCCYWTWVRVTPATVAVQPVTNVATHIEISSVISTERVVMPSPASALDYTPPDWARSISNPPHAPASAPAP